MSRRRRAPGSWTCRTATTRCGSASGTPVARASQGARQQRLNIEGVSVVTHQEAPPGARSPRPRDRRGQRRQADGGRDRRRQHEARLRRGRARRPAADHHVHEPSPAADGRGRHPLQRIRGRSGRLRGEVRVGPRRGRHLRDRQRDDRDHVHRARSSEARFSIAGRRQRSNVGLRVTDDQGFQAG